MMRRLLAYWYPAVSVAVFLYLYVRHENGALSAETYNALFNLNMIVFVFSIIASPALFKRKIPRKYRKAIAEREAREAEEARQEAERAAFATPDLPDIERDAPNDDVAATTLDTDGHKPAQ